ncbi:recombination helicase AddA [Desulfitobacterium hafniense DCB-2]|uniref:ATP-dependent helicase/nuclease subunit A n=1 Tax=Desulfitobacterium hafniense (strain DSM 10664 / DCB-2) TaxID=272564 RepID=ADDA_DESHD|nr:UvrD-helicase domain-containing protein [Desulfitobacterium hafniense]B8FXD7.1 RecName: Full=ATP-dependent helicase/nuclease subunit A; AltName: Full=ATP-dependent helicase/nuclease AddA; AltName: Full=DNA 3'-5' helicase AddA [Desulfitobacterium hafniense DCB-2]ACL20856.1 recombination helicase AddA [Desulfitobacterium hafniense DCB-2]
MNNPKWTPAQQAAIDLKGQLLVAAAAGSGKTAVLVQRLFKQITDVDEQVDVDRFLVVTFTKAAAAEMRERIGKALDEALFGAAEPAQVEHLLQQRALLYRASITTLHSFCMELIRQYFYLIELDPAFRVADEAEADLLRQDTLEDLFEAYYGEETPAFQSLVDAFGTDRDDQPLMASILRLHEFAMSQVHPGEWLEHLPAAYDWHSLDDLMESPWGQVVRQGVRDKVEEGLILLERAYRLAELPGGPVHYLPVLEDDQSRLGFLREMAEKGTWSDIETAFKSAAAFPGLPRGSKKNLPDSLIDEENSKRLREESKKARDEAKKKLEEIKNTVFSVPLTDQLPFLNKMGELVGTLAQVTQHFAREYQKAKRQRNCVDFSDLEHYALQLLAKDKQPTEIALKLQAYYAEVLVDEYQDINPVQERILQLVSRQEEGKANLFMVGDVKQSIYRFRMADPGLFLRKYGEFPHYQEGGGAAPNLVIDLNQNFRSRPEVIQGINYLFYQIMTEGAGEIVYDEQAALRPGAKFVSDGELRTAEGPIEVHLFDPKAIDLSLGQKRGAEDAATEVDSPAKGEGEEFEQNREPESGDDESSLEEAETARIEARLVAARIQKMVLEREFQIHDKELGDYRPVQYADIVILMRSLASVASVYAEEFQKAGIPVYAETNSGYFGTNEVDTVLSLLKIIDNPRLDIPFAAVLRSPLVGMNGTELGKLRSLLPQGDFYETLVLTFWAGDAHRQEEGHEFYSEIREILGKHWESLPQLEVKVRHILETSPEIKEKVDAFFPKLQEWRHRSRRTSLADLLWHLYEDTGYLAYVGTLPAGAQRQANLRVLYDRACRYEATNYRGLFRFLRFLEKFQSQGKDLGNASIVGEKENVVRFITVHSSKGLEFPVVFIAGLGKKFNTRSLSSQLLLHSHLGVGIPLIDIENQVRYPSVIQYAVKERLWQEALAEELRILYVALTRGKERLFLFGHQHKLAEAINKWRSLALSCPDTAFPDGQLRGAKTYLDWLGPALVRHPEDLFKLGSFPTASELPDSSSQWKVILHDQIAGKGPVQEATSSQDEIILPDQETLGEREASEETEIPGETEASGKTEIPGETKNSEETKTSEDKKNLEAQTPETADLDTKNLQEEVFRQLNWQYPYPEGVNQSAKTSVSELKRQSLWYMDNEYSSPSSSSSSSPSALSAPSFLRPQFIVSRKELTPAERGTAVHAAIQHLPLALWRDTWEELAQEVRESMLQEHIDSLIRREILSAEQGGAVSVSQLKNLLDSTSGKRLWEAEEVRREVPFTLSLRLRAQKEPVLVQGIIDAVLLSHQEHEAQVMDFKTDNLAGVPDPELVLTQRYGLQLGLYALAVERLLKVPVRECIIYATSLNREFVMQREAVQAALESVVIV